MTTQTPDLEEPTAMLMPPASIQAEEALLGSIFIDPDVLVTMAVSALDPGDFYIVRNRWVYEAMREAGRGGGAVDFMTVTDALERSGKLVEAGGQAYLMQLIGKTPTSMHAERYAEIVKDRAQRRQMLKIANQLAQDVYDLTTETDTTASRAATGLANSARPSGGAQHISVYASNHYDRIGELANGTRQVKRIPTGFLDFDKCLGGGLRIPEMLLLMGNPGLGKTKFMMQLAFQMGMHEPGAVYEMETDEDQIMDREVSRRSGISDTKLESGKLDDGDWPSYTYAIEQLGNPDCQVFLDFGSGWTTQTLRADLSRLKAEYGIKWYMVDYMKFLRDNYGKDETERLNFLSKQLKQINRELDLASVVIHSMNKEGMASQLPGLTNMSGGADISFDTDKALFMTQHIPTGKEPQIANYRTFVHLKSRSRLNDTMFHLEALADIPLFRDVATKQQNQSEPRGYRP